MIIIALREVVDIVTEKTKLLQIKTQRKSQVTFHSSAFLHLRLRQCFRQKRTNNLMAHIISYHIISYQFYFSLPWRRSSAYRLLIQTWSRLIYNNTQPTQISALLQAVPPPARYIR